MRDVAERHDGAVEPCDERDGLEILADLSFGDGMQDQPAGVGAQLAEREVEGCLLHDSGYLGEGNIVASQFLLAQLDGGFAIAAASQRHLRNRGQIQQFTTNVRRCAPQLVLGELRGRNSEGHDVERCLAELHFGLFGVSRWKVLDSVHRVPDIVEDGIGIGEGCQFDPDGAQAFGGGAHHPLDAGKSYDAFLDAAIDVLLNLPGRGSGRPYRDDHGSKVQLGQVLDGELTAGNDAPDDQEQHEQVGGNGVAREVGDESGFHGRSWSCHVIGGGAVHVRVPLSRRRCVFRLDRQPFTGAWEGADDESFPGVEYLHHPAVTCVSECLRHE